MANKYIIDLTMDEQEYWLNLIKKGKSIGPNVNSQLLVAMAHDPAI